MKLDAKTQVFVKECIEYLLDVIDDRDVEYEILDEFDEPKEKQPFPINYKIDYDKEILYILSVTPQVLK